MKERVLSISPGYGCCLLPAGDGCCHRQAGNLDDSMRLTMKIQVTFQSPHNMVRTMREWVGRGSDNDRVAGVTHAVSRGDGGCW